MGIDCNLFNEFCLGTKTQCSVLLLSLEFANKYLSFGLTFRSTKRPKQQIDEELKSNFYVHNKNLPETCDTADTESAS